MKRSENTTTKKQNMLAAMAGLCWVFYVCPRHMYPFHQHTLRALQDEQCADRSKIITLSQYHPLITIKEGDQALTMVCPHHD